MTSVEFSVLFEFPVPLIGVIVVFDGVVAFEDEAEELPFTAIAILRR